MNGRLKIPILLKTLVVFLFLSSGLIAQAVWQVSGSLTRGLTGGAAVMVDSTLYVLGGYSDSVQSPVDWIQKFNPVTGKFTPVARMKKKRIYLLAAASGKNIYYLGGEVGGGSHQMLGVLERFNTETLVVTAIDTNKKFSRLSMSGLILDSIFYMVGGEQLGGGPIPGGINPYIMEYNLNKSEITFNYYGQFSGHLLRSGQMTTLIDRYIYIFGGTYNTVLPEIYRYHLLSRQLKRVSPNMLVPRANGCAVVPSVSGELMIMGGFNEGNFALNSVEKFRLSDSTSIAIQYASSLNYKRKNFMSAVYNGFIYIFGGTNEFGQLIRPIERYQILTDAEEQEETVPSTYSLGQNYPNPFNPSSVFEYLIPQESEVTLTVYDALGNSVAVLQSGIFHAGTYSQTWNGAEMSSGIYYYELRAFPLSESGTKRLPFRQVKKMLLLK